MAAGQHFSDGLLVPCQWVCVVGYRPRECPYHAREVNLELIHFARALSTLLRVAGLRHSDSQSLSCACAQIWCARALFACRTACIFLRLAELGLPEVERDGRAFGRGVDFAASVGLVNAERATAGTTAEVCEHVAAAHPSCDDDSEQTVRDRTKQTSPGESRSVLFVRELGGASRYDAP